MDYRALPGYTSIGKCVDILTCDCGEEIAMGLTLTEPVQRGVPLMIGSANSVAVSAITEPVLRGLLCVIR